MDERWPEITALPMFPVILVCVNALHVLTNMFFNLTPCFGPMAIAWGHGLPRYAGATGTACGAPAGAEPNRHGAGA